MCGRYTLRDPSRHPWLRECPDELALPRYNIAPSQPIPVVGRDREGHQVCAAARWGFRPRWMDSSRRDPINARAETVAERPMFRRAFEQGRCLVPADGWYEWHKEGTGPSVPYFMHLPGQRPFAFAGIATRDSEGDRTAAILTAPAHGDASGIHPRLPLVIADDAEACAWLEAEPDPALVERLLHDLAATRIELYPVSRRVNRPDNEGPGLIERAAGNGD